MPSLIQNAIRISEDDTYLVSTSRDHHVSHTFRDGPVLTISGGVGEGGFTHRATRNVGELYALVEADRYEEWVLTDDMTFEQIADKLLWMDKPVKEWGVDELRDLVSFELTELHTRVAQYWIGVKTT